MKRIFSIIIPTYNLENCIVECLQSIEAQTISREKFELIVVDDCSSDNTCKNIYEFLKNSTLKVNSVEVLKIEVQVYLETPVLILLEETFCCLLMGTIFLPQIALRSLKGLLVKPRMI